MSTDQMKTKATTTKPPQSSTSRLKAFADSKREKIDDPNQIQNIPLDLIRFDPTQPRQEFYKVDGVISPESLTKLNEMADTLKWMGQLQPIAVIKQDDGSYMVEFGERRVRGMTLVRDEVAKLLAAGMSHQTIYEKWFEKPLVPFEKREDLKTGFSTIRAMVVAKEEDARTLLIKQLLENAARSDLSATDEATSVKKLIELGFTAKEISESTGISKAKISKLLVFIDAEVNRRWFQSGITNSWDMVYRLQKELSLASQVEIERRVNLSPDDPEFLAKPIVKSVFEKFVYADLQREKAERDAADLLKNLPQEVSPEVMRTHAPDPLVDPFVAAVAANNTPSAISNQMGTDAASNSGYFLPDDVKASLTSLPTANDTPTVPESVTGISMPSDSNPVSIPPASIEIQATLGMLSQLLTKNQGGGLDINCSLRLSISDATFLANLISAENMQGRVSESEAVDVIQKALQG